MSRTLRIFAASLVALVLVAGASGCVTHGAYYMLTDIEPKKRDVPIRLERLERVEVRKHAGDVDLAFEARTAAGERKFFLALFELRGRDPAIARAVRDASAFEGLQRLFHPSETSARASQEARLADNRVVFVLDGAAATVTPVDVIYDERTGLKVAGWTAFILVAPLTIAVDIILIPLYLIKKYINPDWAPIFR